MDIAHTFELQIAFHQLAEAEMKRLPPAMELPDPFVRKALLSSPSARVQRTMTPRFSLDIYDNGSRQMPESHVARLPLAASSPGVYIGGNAVPNRILAAARQAVADLVDVQVRESDRAAFTCPRAVIDFRDGFMLTFFFYSQRIYHVPPPEPMPGGRPHTAVYEREPR